MNNETIFQQILDVFFVTSTPLIIIIYAFLELKRMDKHDKKLKENSPERNPDCDRRDLEKYLSGFDYV